MSDGSIVIVGRELSAYVQPRSAFVIKLTALGVIDTTFGAGGKVIVDTEDIFDSFRADTVAIQDDRIVVGGTRSLIAPVEETMVFELDRNGFLNTSFGDSGFSFNDLAPAQERIGGFALEPNGKILVAGIGRAANVDTVPYIARLQQNGQVDPEFAPKNLGVERSKAEDVVAADGAYLLTDNGSRSTPGDTRRYTVRKFITKAAATAPTVSISGGNKTLHDTDEVAGEIMTFTGVATDSGGTVARTLWYVNNVAAGTGLTATLTLNDGPNVVSFTAIDDDGAQTTASVGYNVNAPAQPLPRIDALSDQGRVNDSKFSIAIRNVSRTPVDTASRTETLDLTGHIFPAAADKDFYADIFVVVATPFGWLMRNADGAFAPWNGMVTDLVPAYKNVRLNSHVPVTIYSGVIADPATYSLYVGYRRTDGTELVYTRDGSAFRITP